MLCLCCSYGRVYTTDPYHALTPAAAAYGVGAMVRKLTQALQNNQCRTSITFLGSYEILIFFPDSFVLFPQIPCFPF